MEWYYLDNQNKQVGPLTEIAMQEVIGNGTVKKETLVWNESMDSWLPAGSSSMSSRIKSNPPPPPVTKIPINSPPAPVVTAAVGFGRDDSLVYPTNPPRSPHMAWLNLLFPGVAQIFFGKTYLGTVCIVVCFILSALTGIAYPLILAAMIVDAYMTGNRLKEGMPVEKWQLFPKKK